MSTLRHTSLPERSVWVDGPPVSPTPIFVDTASVSEVGWEDPFPFADSPLLMKAQDTGYEIFTGEPSEVPQPSGPGLCWGGKQE